MATISGAVSKMGLKVASTWGTAVAAGAGDKFVSELSWSGNVSELVPRAIGSGQFMDYSATIGNYIPTVSLTGEFGFNNTWPVVFACFFGTSGAPTGPGVDGQYTHTMTFNTTLNAKYVTLAWEDTTTTTGEFPTAAVRTIGLRTTSVPGFLEATTELLANKFEKSSATNTNATLANVTLTDTELATAAFDDDFWIDDASTGALAAGDQYNITGFDFSMTRPQEIIPEIKGSSGNGSPISTGVASGTFQVTVKNLADHAYFTAWEAETVKKALLTFEGTLIGGTTYKAINLYLPNMKMITEPQVPFSSPGENALTLSFKLLAASSAPTGMTSVYPYMVIVNSRSSSFLA